MPTRPRVFALLLVSAPVSLACGGGGDGGDGDGTEASSSTATTATGSGPAPSTSGDDTSGGGSSTAGTTDPTNDGDSSSGEAPPQLDCSVWAQDCPRGSKCVPSYDRSGALEATLCVPLDPDAAPGGSPCASTSDRGDGCDAGSLCVPNGDGTSGTCLPICGGDPRSPTCEGRAACFSSEDGGGVCIQACDPLDDTCPEGTACYGAALQLLCLPVPRDAAEPGQPCAFASDCQPGHQCVPAEQLPGCTDAACCAAWCSPDDPMPCADPAATCEPFSPGGNPQVGDPPQGVCVTP